MRIAFDIDDTLIIPSVALVGGYYERTSPYDVPNYDTVAIYKWFQAQGHTMILWSGGGVDYARMWGQKLGLEPFEAILKDKKGAIDIAFDDCDVDLGTVNVKVKRLNNSISREEWNKNHGETFRKLAKE